MTPSRPVLRSVTALRVWVASHPDLAQIETSAEVLAELERELDARGPDALAAHIGLAVQLGWSLVGRVARLHFADGTTRDVSL